MNRIISIILTLAYSFLSLFGLSFDDGVRIWTKKLIFTAETRSDIFIPDENVWENGSEYPTVIELSDGTLLAAFEVFDREPEGFRIMSSADG